MGRTVRTVLAALAVALVCLNGASAGPIAGVEVVGPANPAHYGLWAGEFLGDLNDYQKAAKENELTVALAQQNLLLGDEINAAMKAALTQSGISVAPDANGAYPPGSAKLAIEIEKSTYERRRWGPVGPHLVIHVKLTDATSKRSLFSRTYVYDFYSLTLTYEILRPEEKYGFEEPEDVLKHPDVAAAGFRAAIPMLVDDVVKEINKRRGG
jgi:hypothetical protein